MRIVIIEDELLAQQELVKCLNELDVPIDVVTSLRSVKTSVKWLKANPEAYDLIFMDIELLDGQSFEIFQHVELEKPVIFLTAYDEFAIQAFKVNSIDYLLKPLSTEHLEQALIKYQKLTQKRINLSVPDIQLLLRSVRSSYKERFIIKIGDTFRHIDVRDVAFFFSDAKTTYLVTQSDKHLIVDSSLHELENQLDPSQFFRVSRKYLVHIQSVHKASRYFRGRLKLELNPPRSEDVLVSRVNVQPFLEWLGK